MTAISELYAPIRHLLGDHDSTVQQYADAALLTAVQTIIRMGKVEDQSLSADALSIDPGLASDPNDYALVLLHTVRSFADSRPEHYAWGTRAAHERTGSYRAFVASLQAQINDLENGTMFDGWQSYSAWLQGVMGTTWADLLMSYVELNEE